MCSVKSAMACGSGVTALIPCVWHLWRMRIMYFVVCSMHGSREPWPTGEFGPRNTGAHSDQQAKTGTRTRRMYILKWLGIFAAAILRYASGRVFHCLDKLTPFLPMSGNLGAKEISKPVAHTKVSTSRTLPDFNLMPFGTISEISSVTTLTFGSVRASK